MLSTSKYESFIDRMFNFSPILGIIVLPIIKSLCLCLLILHQVILRLDSNNLPIFLVINQSDDPTEHL